MDLLMHTLHLKDPLVLLGFEGSALSLLFLFFHLELICFVIVLSTITKDHILCAEVPWFIHYNFHLKTSGMKPVGQPKPVCGE